MVDTIGANAAGEPRVEATDNPPARDGEGAITL